jgi:endonuclease III-like uncharacterized protein
MHPNHIDPAEDRRLRFVFNHAVVSLGLASDATFEDVARNLARLSTRHYGKPVAIDVLLGPRLADPVRPAGFHYE